MVKGVQRFESSKEIREPESEELTIAERERKYLLFSAILCRRMPVLVPNILILLSVFLELGVDIRAKRNYLQLILPGVVDHRLKKLGGYALPP